MKSEHIGIGISSNIITLIQQGGDGAGRSYSISHKKLGSSGHEGRRKRGGSMDNLIDISSDSSKVLRLDTLLVIYDFFCR